MIKTNTNPALIDELLEKGVETIYPNQELLQKKLLSGDRIRLYCGYDPSASALHIGNAITLNKLRQFQELGHEVIFLIGDFTGMIGDPTDKMAARKPLTRRQVLENAKGYKAQAEKYISFKGKNKAVIKYNSAWNDKLKFTDLIQLASNFTVQYMIQREMFQKRLKEEQPIHLHEFLYPLTQAYDSVAMDVDLELGGNDQMFNMMAGRDLMKSLKNKEKFVLTLKLITDKEGKKMGKSEGNVVFLNERPNDMYGKVMSWPDEVLASAFELCTFLPMSEIREIKKAIENNPRDAKMKLAKEITTINHGEKLANEAEEHFIKTVQKKEVDPSDIMETYTDEKTYSMSGTQAIAVTSGLFSSNNEFKRLLKEGGIKVNGKKITDINQLNEEISQTSDNLMIQRGRKSLRIKKK
jgi:tyrosyl-tRNA synthetase